MGLTLPPPQAVLPMGALQHCTVCTLHIMGTGGLKGEGRVAVHGGREGLGGGGGGLVTIGLKLCGIPTVLTLNPEGSRQWLNFGTG
jgi:hypothetical protein